MRGLLGIAWHSPFQLREWFVEWRNTLPKERQEVLIPQFLGWGEPEVYDDAMVVFVPSMSVFRKHRDALFASDAAVVLFENPVMLAQAKIKTVDATGHDGIRFFRVPLTQQLLVEHLRAALNREEEYNVEPEDVDLVPTLVANAAGSLTEALLNLTSRCRVSEKRREITSSYVDWLLSDRDITSLEDRLQTLGVDDDAIRYAVDWLSGKQGQAARAICKRVGMLRSTGKNINYDKLCKDSPVQPHDLRYLLNYARSARVKRGGGTTMEIFENAKIARANAAVITADEEIVDGLIADEIDEGVESAADAAFERELAGEHLAY